MNIAAPTWQMKIPCPCCGQGSPIFLTCPACGYLTGHCAETGETFKDPRALEKGFTETCSACTKETKSFRLATSTQILDAGFAKDEYE